MWRTVIVSQGERITVKDGNIRITCGEDESIIPLADIYAVVIDNRAALISVNALALLAESGAHVFFCDEKHIPVGVTLPLNRHFRPLAVIKKQLSLSQDEKDEVWQRLVQAKIFNQAQCLKYAGVDRDKVSVLLGLAENVAPGDADGLEAVAAKKYFQALFLMPHSTTDMPYYVRRSQRRSPRTDITVFSDCIIVRRKTPLISRTI